MAILSQGTGALLALWLVAGVLAQPDPNHCANLPNLRVDSWNQQIQYCDHLYDTTPGNTGLSPFLVPGTAGAERCYIFTKDYMRPASAYRPAKPTDASLAGLKGAAGPLSTYDAGGHLIANGFGGSPNLNNIVLMLPSINSPTLLMDDDGTYRAFEIELEKCLDEFSGAIQGTVLDCSVDSPDVAPAQPIATDPQVLVYWHLDNPNRPTLISVRVVATGFVSTKCNIQLNIPNPAPKQRMPAAAVTVAPANAGATPCPNALNWPGVVTGSQFTLADLQAFQAIIGANNFNALATALFAANLDNSYWFWCSVDPTRNFGVLRPKCCYAAFAKPPVPAFNPFSQSIEPLEDYVKKQYATEEFGREDSLAGDQRGHLLKSSLGGTFIVAQNADLNAGVWKELYEKHFEYAINGAGNLRGFQQFILEYPNTATSRPSFLSVKSWVIKDEHNPLPPPAAPKKGAPAPIFPMVGLAGPPAAPKKGAPAPIFPMVALAGGGPKKAPAAAKKGPPAGPKKGAPPPAVLPMAGGAAAAVPPGPQYTYANYFEGRFDNSGQ